MSYPNIQAEPFIKRATADHSIEHCQYRVMAGVQIDALMKFGMVEQWVHAETKSGIHIQVFQRQTA